MTRISHPAVDSLRCGPFAVHRLCAIPKLALHRLEQQRATEFTHQHRRDEFIKSRLLYRVVSGNDAPLLNRTTGECIWPAGFSGSLSHKDGQVVLVYRRGVTPIGIDIETVRATHNTLLEQTVLTDSERRLLDYSPEQRTFLFFVLFSAKESLFKCLYSFNQTMFYFHDAVVERIDSIRQSIVLVAQGQRLTAYYTKMTIDNRSYVLTVVSM